MTQQLNTSFSTKYSNLQMAWDSTSLGALKTCPRYYQLSIVEGWESKRRNFHLDFGLWLHSSRERYYHGKTAGLSHDDALDTAVEWLLKATWDRELGRPWNSEDVNKNRFTLVRTLVWYLDQWKDDPLKTITLTNGKPAVELSFQWQTDFKTLGGEAYTVCGHLDRLATLNDTTYISDLKTTGSTLSKSYFDQFSPDNQMSIYSLGGKVVYQTPISGIIIDAAQVAVTFSRFQRGIVSRTDEQLNEFYKELGQWLAIGEMYARNGYWPMNDKACFRCTFRGICSKPKSSRQQWLEFDFQKRIWDPLQRRGDI